MHTQITSEKTFSITYYRPGHGDKFGISVGVVGDSKRKVRRDAKELLLQALADINDVEHAPTIPTVSPEVVDNA